MRKHISFLLIAFLSAMPLYSEESEQETSPYDTYEEIDYEKISSQTSDEITYRDAWGSAAEDITYDAVAVSMVGWGVGLALGIAVLSGIISAGGGSEDSSGTSHSTAHFD